MKRLRVNNELTLNYAEGFHQMDAAELRRFFGSEQNREGIYDEENHIVISPAWTKTGFLNYLTDPKSVLQGAETGMKQTLADYRRTDTFETEIGERRAKGIRFDYTANENGVAQSGELMVFRVKDRFYAVSFAARRDSIDTSRAALKEILSTVSVEA